MNVPADLHYTNDHEWIRINGNIATVGISDFAQSELGDIVFVEIETLGEQLEKGQVFGTIEAVKTVSDLFMPVSGKVLQINDKINESPDLINKEPYGEGWLISVEVDDPGQVQELLDAAAYKGLISA
ncbi:MAG: glycine cleavage system protein GcvH [Bacteroidales bacterium]|nr:glycine cleavage system protein GcvH [Bacteroidales bacterium]